MNKALQKIALQRAINHAKFAHYVPGKTKAPVPFAKNHDYIGGTFYHGPMDRWKSVSEYREKAEAPVEAWRKDPEEKKKHKKRQKKNKKKAQLSKRAGQADAVSMMINEVADTLKENLHGQVEVVGETFKLIGKIENPFQAQSIKQKVEAAINKQFQNMSYTTRQSLASYLQWLIKETKEKPRKEIFK